MKNPNIVLSQNALGVGLAGMVTTALLAVAVCRGASPLKRVVDAISRQPRENVGLRGPDPVMLGLYAAIALGLATGAMAVRRHNCADHKLSNPEADEPERRVVRRVRAGSV